MTEQTYIPDPREVISKLKAIDLESYIAGSPLERETLLDVTKWLIVFLHTLDIQLVPKKHRSSFEEAERTCGHLVGEILLRAEKAKDEESRKTIAELYGDLQDDLLFAVGVFDQNLASLFAQQTKCQT